MSILSKFLVVLVTILSVVLVALVVPFVATQDNLKNQLADETNARKAAEQSTAILESELQAAQGAESDTIKLLNQKVNDLEAEKEAEKALRQQAQVEAQTARATLGDLKADYTVLANAMAEHVKTNQLLTDQLATSQKLVQEQGTRLLQQADRIDALAGERDTLVRTVRKLQEQAVANREELDTVQTQLASVPLEVRQRYLESEELQTDIVPEPPIAGQVVAIQDAGDGIVLVQLNVGQSDRVQEGMKFLVHQGDQFKGTMVISHVEPRASVGRMMLIKTAPAAGDSVYAGPAS